MTNAFDSWPGESAVAPPKGDGSSRLLTVALDDALRAREALPGSLRLYQRETIRIEDATIVIKDAGGRGGRGQGVGHSPERGAPGVTA